MSYSKSSAAEVRSQLYRAKDRNYITEVEFENLINQTIAIGKMLGGFMNYLKKSEIKGLKYKVNETESLYHSDQFEI